MDKLQTNLLLQFFKAVSEPDRLKILGLLANEPHTTSELMAKLQLKQKTVSRHLHFLQKAQIIIEDTTAFKTSYRLDSSWLEKLNELVTEAAPLPSLAERTLQEYVVDGRLKAIPQKPEERQIILEWLADKFEPDKRYTESEITELIREYYDRPLTLRRVLADNRFLLHTGRQYWRPIPGRVY